ncbi:MAG: histidine kinase [Candidatus Cohnella colombiensis]|uniref:Histidine kinase n=1 Tax=Candidatus Cohnella colombiensis TaxID=3121368 RepID=A0AA95EXL5_9BACL|nr:MAG: histidine kinase [Cohnella sp.]
MNKLWNIWVNLGIKERLLFTNILLITIPLIMIGIQYYGASKSMVDNIARKNLHETIVKNNEIIDSKLEQIKEYILGFAVDKDLEELLSITYDSNDEYAMYLLDQEISNILNKYFLHSSDIYSVYLVTEPYIFGNSSARGYLPKQTFHQTDLYEQAIKADGKLTWAPTYSFVDMFKQPQMSSVSFDYSRMFSAIKLLNHVDFTYKREDIPDAQKGESPVLLVNFNDLFFNKIFENNIPINNMYYFVISKDGHYITHQDKEKLGQKVNFEWLDKVVSEGSGIDTVNIDGQRMIITYDTSKTTEWISVFAVREDFIVTDMIPVIRTNLFSAVIVLIIISLFISILVSTTITRPIRTLNAAISQVGYGNFNLIVPEKGSLEFRKLIYKFNSMNGKIQNLIEENYKSTIMKKEAEIKALNLQLNPHFMYNTLNIINLKLIKNGQDETSDIIMSLSTMLKYSLETGKDVILLERDLNYTKSYIHIMETRFEGKFKVEYHIDPRLYEFYVPKFFLQPLVENALIHGFNGLKRVGTLKISGWFQDDNRYFCVEDNGVGISEDKLRELLDENSSSIGINNVRDRIRIIYGEQIDFTIESEVSVGTKVIIQLPK